MAETQTQYDVDGFDALTAALRELINDYPALSSGEKIAFATLDKNRGKAMFPMSGAIVETDRRFITGDREQTCYYPFTVVYRAAGLSENNRANVKEWLDNLGKWLENLDEYPTLTGNRKIIEISRATPGYLDNTNDDGVEDWAISIRARYINLINKEI